MSAFICGPDHIKALATFAVSGRRDTEPVSESWLRYALERSTTPGHALLRGFQDKREQAEVIANILHDENIRSVSARYEERPQYVNGVSVDNLPGLCERPQRLAVSQRDVSEYPVGAPVAIFKMCDCLEYQSCETADYRSTLAFDILTQIRKGAVRRLPGYDDAPWEYTRNHKAAA